MQTPYRYNGGMVGFKTPYHYNGGMVGFKTPYHYIQLLQLLYNTLAA
jgi:hypothetical protein